MNYLINKFLFYYMLVKSKLGFQKNTDAIPVGYYCYNEETNEPCEYYLEMGNEVACSFLNYKTHIDDDYLFCDKCKICDKNISLKDTIK